MIKTVVVAFIITLSVLILSKLVIWFIFFISIYSYSIDVYISVFGFFIYFFSFSLTKIIFDFKHNIINIYIIMPFFILGTLPLNFFFRA